MARTLSCILTTVIVSDWEEAPQEQLCPGCPVEGLTPDIAREEERLESLLLSDRLR